MSAFSGEMFSGMIGIKKYVVKPFAKIVQKNKQDVS